MSDRDMWPIEEALMPSRALQVWASDRMLRLQEVSGHCAAVSAVGGGTSRLAEESLRAFVLLLSGHFQAFCRDLYTESVQFVTSSMHADLQPCIQRQFLAELKLNSRNPTSSVIRDDFERFGIQLEFDSDPANGSRLEHLAQLIAWRNNIAHRVVIPPVHAPALTLAVAETWNQACDGLATWLDGWTYDVLRRIVGLDPW